MFFFENISKYKAYQFTYKAKERIAFFHKHSHKIPAIFLSIPFILGICYFFTKSLLLIIFFSFLIFDKPFIKSFIKAIILFSIGYVLALNSANFPLDKTGYGSGEIKITAAKQANKFKKGYIYKGILNTFSANDIQYKNIPFSMFSNNTQLLQLNHLYFFEGSFKNKTSYLSLKPKTLILNKKIFSLTQLRYNLKKKTNFYLTKNIPNHSSKQLFTGLLTGNLDDNYLRYHFSKTGLQHILAISGFHFSMLIIFLSFLFKVFPSYIKTIALIVSATLYFLFIGNTPSVQRAYLCTTIALVGNLILKKPIAINSLFLAAFIQLIFNPKIFFNIGFQLSFGSCFGIICFYNTFEKCIEKILIKREKADLLKLSPLEKPIVKTLEYLRKATALSLSVNITIFPIILFHFKKFAMLSFIYNLFIPILISISFFLLITALCIHIIFPFLSHLINNINSSFTKEILNIIESVPVICEYWIRVQHISYIFLILYLYIILQSGLFLYFKQKDKPLFQYI